MEKENIGAKKCLGTKHLCENGYAPVCNTDTGEWECRGQIAVDDIQSSEDIDGSKGADDND